MASHKVKRAPSSRNNIVETCLICGSDIGPSPKNPKPVINCSPRSLSSSIEVYFLLSKVIELPRFLITNYFKSCAGSSPNNWIKVCRKCSNSFVREVVSLHGELLATERKLKQACRRLTNEIKRSSKMTKGKNETGPKSVVNEIRSFVKSHVYDDIKENPFISGDNIANMMQRTLSPLPFPPSDEDDSSSVGNESIAEREPSDNPATPDREDSASDLSGNECTDKEESAEVTVKKEVEEEPDDAEPDKETVEMGEDNGSSVEENEPVEKSQQYYVQNGAATKKVMRQNGKHPYHFYCLPCGNAVGCADMRAHLRGVYHHRLAVAYQTEYGQEGEGKTFPFATAFPPGWNEDSIPCRCKLEAICNICCDYVPMQKWSRHRRGCQIKFGVEISDGREIKGENIKTLHWRYGKVRCATCQQRQEESGKHTATEIAPQSGTAPDVEPIEQLLDQAFGMVRPENNGAVSEHNLPNTV